MVGSMTEGRQAGPEAEAESIHLEPQEEDTER